jgi:hypothetical protein
LLGVDAEREKEDENQEENVGTQHGAPLVIG